MRREVKMYSVLIIEDESIIRKGLNFCFDWSAYSCKVIGEAENGISGLEKIKSLKPDIVLLDINMPKMNGLEMLDQLEYKTFETIIISGYEDFSYAQKSINHNVCAYLLKPISDEGLEEALKKAIRRISMNEEYIEISNELADAVNSLDLHNINISDNFYLSTNQVIEYIIENYNKKINIEDLMNYTNRGKTYLNEKFKEDTSMTINNFINKYRIQKSIYFMETTNESISNISDLSGFSNYRYFIDVFKKYTNLTPSEFLNKFFKK